MRFKLLAITGMAIALAACTNDDRARQDEHLVGKKLTDVSSLVTPTGEAQHNIAIFDKTVNRVHQFDLNANVLSRSFAVQRPGVEHYVLYDQPGNYVVDFSTKHISVFDKYGEANHNPIQFVGTPKSAAFNSTLGLLVMYDDKMTIGVLKLSPEGKVLKAQVFPGDFGGASISCGDIDENGNLIAALSNGKIVVADLTAALASGAWTGNYTTKNTVLNNAVWLAPVRGSVNLVLVQQEDRISLVDLTSESVTDGPLTNRKRVMHYGKGPDGHIIYEHATDSSLMLIAYVRAGVIETRQVNHSPYAILNSQLDLSAERWTTISAKSSTYNVQNGVTSYTNRSVTRYIFNSGSFIAVKDERLPEHAKFELSADRLFALMPTRMGSAINYNLANFTSRPLTHFNVPYIDKR
jgi:hypothetical protein